MHNRDRMRASNLLVREYLLANGYDNIWFKPHTKRNDLVFTQNGKYLATDLWNLFDGICTLDNHLVFLQMKTNAWPKTEPILKWIRKIACEVLVLNVTKNLKECNGHYKVFVRHYP